MFIIPNYFAFVQKRAGELGIRFNDSSITAAQRESETAKLTRVVAYELHNGLNGAPIPGDKRVGLYLKANSYGHDEHRLDFKFSDTIYGFAKIMAQTGATHASIAWLETENIYDETGTQHRNNWGAPKPEPGIHDTLPTEPPVEEPEEPIEEPGKVNEGFRAVIVLMARLIEQNEKIINQNEEIKKSFNEGLSNLRGEIAKGIKVRF